MTVLRAPNQFTPGGSGGPVTPSCCGCCCCCCCAGTLVATGIALPLILHQVTRDDQDPVAVPPVPEADDPHQVPVGRGRRVLGIVLSALALPLAVLAGAAGILIGGDEEMPIAIGAALVAAGVATFGYVLAGVRGAVRLAIPLIVVLIAVVMLILELAVWAVAIFGDSNAIQILGGLGILAIPVLSTILIVAFGRRRRLRTP